MKHFIQDYKIKKNYRCQKDAIYTIKVIENIRSGRLFNLKILKKAEIFKIGIELFKVMYQNEINILEQMKNPNMENIVDIYFDDLKYSDLTLFIVTSYTPKETLFDYVNQNIKNMERFSVKDIYIIMKNLIELAYKFKNNNIIYRNFSLDNIFFYKKDNYFTLCLRNLYFSTYYTLNQQLRGMTGNLWYLSPEVLSDMPYDSKSDIWSLGVILYQLITHENPFEKTTNKDQMLKLLKNPNIFKSTADLRLYEVSEPIMNLLTSMLVEDPNKRRTVDYLVESPIFTTFDKICVPRETFGPLLDFSVDELSKINFKISSVRPLHDLIFYLVYNLKDYFLNIEDIMILNEFYKYFDKNNDGLISFNEIMDQLVTDNFEKNIPEHYTAAIKQIVDCEFRKKITPSYQLNYITYNSFLTSNIIMKLIKANKDKKLREEMDIKIEIMFNELDTDRSGSISIDEIQSIFKLNTYDRNVKVLYEEVYTNKMFDSNKIINLVELSPLDFKNLLTYEFVKNSEYNADEYEL
eukprot:CAMPEP_0170522686 /NCGR_PEP_ID=MMETSP0209-20121228/8106_1 /TAXON_ID=665100 ORGANISM="Litonotus pictus, Strain P1" /NCGR_SAMPLE_ID=MMETSP0209 /ASSEMBLY_ACC=CAM_ASM_000301 /LENGTH=520 /DNA_ID=CAMNT_0010810323 /DNA_START=66 /DNA_END=1628 /DNA_ORIENTATION=-